MNSKLLYQLRVDLEHDAAQELINTKNINSCKNLGNIIKEENGELVCHFLYNKIFDTRLNLLRL